MPQSSGRGFTEESPLLDDPTQTQLRGRLTLCSSRIIAGFDPMNRRLLMDIVEEQKLAGATVIMVTHQLEEWSGSVTGSSCSRTAPSSPTGRSRTFKSSSEAPSTGSVTKASCPRRSLYDVITDSGGRVELAPRPRVAERNSMLERTQAGLAAARAPGTKGGRRKLLDDKKIAELKTLRGQGFTVSRLAEMFGISEPSVCRYLNALSTRAISRSRREKDRRKVYYGHAGRSLLPGTSSSEGLCRWIE